MAFIERMTCSSSIRPRISKASTCAWSLTRSANRPAASSNALSSKVSNPSGRRVTKMLRASADNSLTRRDMTCCAVFVNLRPRILSLTRPDSRRAIGSGDSVLMIAIYQQFRRRSS